MALMTWTQTGIMALFATFAVQLSLLFCVTIDDWELSTYNSDKVVDLLGE